MSRTYLKDASGSQFYVEDNPALVKFWLERGFSRVESEQSKPATKAPARKPTAKAPAKKTTTRKG